MSKRYRSNYSLWPEQARPRRTIPMTIAIGGFAIGIVCAVAAHSVVTDFLKPTAPPEVAATQDDAIAQVPIYATAAAPAAASSEQASRNRARAVAKVTLPGIGTRGPLSGADTDGRGGAIGGRAGEALGGEQPNAATSAQAVAIAPTPEPAAEVKPAEEPAAAATEAPKAKQKARATNKTTRTAKKKRGRASDYAYRNTNPFFGWGGGGYRNQPYYARQQYYGRYQYY